MDENISNNTNLYIPNYDYVPLYKKEKEEINEEKVDNNELSVSECYCINCGKKILNTDNYCYNCGSFQDNSKKIVNPIIKNIINIIEIVILILVIYFSLNILSPNFFRQNYPLIVLIIPLVIPSANFFKNASSIRFASSS